MSDAVDLITLIALKTDLKIRTSDANDTTWDATLERIISGVSRAIATHCGRTFVEATDTASKIDGDGSAILLVKWPILDITTLINDETTVVETTNWEVYKERGHIELTDGSVWTKGLKKVTITYRHGYEDIPDDIQMAAIAWCSKKFFDIKDNRVGVSTRSTADGSSTTYATSFVSKDMPDEVKALIEPYRSFYGDRWST
jgi:hypothetical protein